MIVESIIRYWLFRLRTSSWKTYSQTPLLAQWLNRLCTLSQELEIMYIARDTRYDNVPQGWFRRCGRSGLLLPSISVGCWHNFGGTGTDSGHHSNESAFHENCQAMLFAAFDMGVTHFDLANNYGPPPGSAEERVGRILKEGFASYRDELIISTKVAGICGPDHTATGVPVSICSPAWMPRRNFPWLGRWEENHLRPWVPWNQQGLACGMEFGVSPMLESRRQMVARGSLFDVPTFRWLPAKSRLHAEYCAFVRAAEAMPKHLTWDGIGKIDLH